MSERIRKATAVVIRGQPGDEEMLVFDHPLEDGGIMVQLPAGTVELEEEPDAGAIRELLEETGVRASEPLLADIRDEMYNGLATTRWVYVFVAPPAFQTSGPSRATAASRHDVTGCF